MSEKFNPEKGLIPENSENQKYRGYKEAEAEMGRIMRDIESVFSRSLNRSEAERIVVESIAPLMDRALQKLDEAYKEWLEDMQKNIGQETKESS